MTSPMPRPRPADLELSDEDRSKDEFFIEVAHVAEAMIAAHGKDFAIGALILSARFIAEGKPLIKRQGETVVEWMAAAKTK
ncbi:hypothetical protein SAMN05444161_2793 [Rhizobiales bacterium GAS191]|jgi:hypothetical protein|nr:hypothetical protein SAMN05519103_01995 [Rhizobiales bacterium GAS113]SED22313.1 hypothetical protein SAMN05444161_2793 [Rhizobiales bacterium GAS191]